MNDIPHHLDRLLSLLGAKRSDENVEAFIRKFDPPPIITVDKEDDADDEFIEFKSQGFGLAFAGDILHSFHLHAGEEDDDYARYDLPLPMGLSFHQLKSELLEHLPQPDAEGGGHDDFFGDIPDWIRFDNVDGYSIHLEFTPNNRRIRVVTVLVLNDG